MTLLVRSRTEWDNVVGVELNERADVLLSLAKTKSNRSSTDVRMELIRKLRTAIAKGNYFVSSADLAGRLMDSMSEGAMLRFRNDSGGSRPSPGAGGLPTHGFPYATFPPQRASESAEEVNDERVGEADRKRWS